MITKKIERLVEAACKESTNYFGYEIWTNHILPVVKYTKLMAKKLRADEEIVEIAALLHDYASIKDYVLYEDHHVHGAELAEKILKKYNYPTGKIKQVKQCILSHRGSKVSPKLSKEALCLTDSDSMVHFDSISSLLYLAFFSHRMNVNEAKDWLIQKLERSWNKMSPEAKEIVKDKYEASRLLFGNSLGSCIKLEAQETQTLDFVRLFEYVLAVAKLLGEETAWRLLGNCIVERRMEWLESNRDKLDVEGTEVEKAYNILLLKYLNIKRSEVPLIEKTQKKITYRSYNFCPVLEACKALHLDTREVCKLSYEKPTQAFLSRLNPRLKFKRNYEKIRPHADYCEESIELRE